MLAWLCRRSWRLGAGGAKRRGFGGALECLARDLALVANAAHEEVLLSPMERIAQRFAA
jgi:hypothetical protein